MSLIVTVIVGLVSLIAGFIGGKLYTEKTLQQGELKQQIKDSQSQMETYKNEVSTHLTVTRNLMDEMKSNYDSVVTQLAKTTQLLETPKPVGDANISYFATDTAAQLRSVSTNRENEKRDSTPIMSQPSDYSEQSTGLFTQGISTKKSEDETVA